MRWPAAPQGGKNIELPDLKVVAVECRTSSNIEVSRKSGDSRQDFERADIKIGSFATPGGDERIDTVSLTCRHHLVCHDAHTTTGR